MGDIPELEFIKPERILSSGDVSISLNPKILKTETLETKTLETKTLKTGDCCFIL